MPGSLIVYVMCEGVVDFIVKSFLVGGHDYGSFYEDVGAIPNDIKFAKALGVFAGCISCVSFSYHLAPTKKKISALIISILVILLAIKVIIQDFPMLQKGYYQDTIRGLVACIAVIISYQSLPTEKDLINRRLKTTMHKIVNARTYLPRDRFDQASRTYTYCEDDIRSVDELYPELSKAQRFRKKEEYIQRMENEIHRILYES